jgi:hypothetical protein
VQNYSKVADGLGTYSERIEEPNDLVSARECITVVFPKVPGFAYMP